MKYVLLLAKKDYIISFSNKLTFLMGLSLLTPLGVKFLNWSSSSIANIWSFDKFAYIATWILMLIYFIYAQYEAKKYKQCSSCQIGNQIGIIFKRLVVSSTIFGIALFLLNPNFALEVI